MAFSGFQDFNPDFGGSLQRFLAASPGITVGSGYRSPERQAELYAAAVKKHGSEKAARKWVAPPGKSRHNMRVAADLAFPNDAARQWAHANAAKYGLNFRMGHEPWHIELIGGAPTAVPDDPAGTDDSTAALLAEAIVPRKSYDLSNLVSGAETRLAGGDTGGNPQMQETGGDTAAPPLQYQTASLSPETLAAPWRYGQRTLQPASPLADLFDIKAIGQAGMNPAAPVRRF